MIVDGLLAFGAFIATMLGIYGNTKIPKRGDRKLDDLSCSSVILAIVVLLGSLFKVYLNTLEAERLNNELSSATEELLSIERLVFDQTVRFGGGNKLIWDGPARIPGGATVRIFGYPMELNFYYGGKSSIVVPESASEPRFVYIQGTPGDVAYDWAVSVKEKPNSNRFFEMGNVSVLSTYELGEWKSSREKALD
ncbi:hypothetical protein [Photobacterium sanguinicancri]|uniref:hypothetical protein n=1 Tax=Photobacterium sanguinicancri TaxID=875932 RepID=UPI0026E3FFE4|nr:hypothetical protein [Photobacterium sanguinicancri]MDO6501223.1 hypothetical protein [Photobacterium sanguinicancri]